jgi:hypothetical protein
MTGPDQIGAADGVAARLTAAGVPPETTRPGFGPVGAFWECAIVLAALVVAVVIVVAGVFA